VRPLLLVLLSIAGLVLAVGLGNAAHLAASRALESRREMAIRAALGATAGRVWRLRLLEGACLSGLGTALGVALAVAAVRLTGSIAPRTAAIAGSAATVDLRPLEIDMAAATPIAVLMALATLVLGILPHRRLDPAALTGARSSSVGAAVPFTRGRRLLLGGQTAIATLLLTVTALFLVLVVRLTATAPGFDGAGVTVMAVGRVHDLDAAARGRYYTAVLRAVATTPGVGSAALNDYVPLTNEDDYEGLEIPGRPRDGAATVPREEWRRVSAGYFRTLGIPLERGRLFGETDDERAASVVIINRALARKYWPGADPVGARIRITSPAYGWSEVIGVVGDVREAGLDRPAKPMMFVPYQRDPRPVMGLFVKLAGDDDATVAAVRRAVASVDPTRPVVETRAMGRIVDDSYAIQRSTLWAAGALAGLTLLLMLGGIYAIVGLVASSRAPEIGLRLALGASSREVLVAVIGRPCRAAAAGIAVGMGAAVAAAHLLQSQVAGMPSPGPAIVGGAASLVALAVAAACLVPARHALRIDPVVALRSE
jgi:putative ABC transport system permease protein